MSRQSLKKITLIFKELNMLQGRVWKWISNETAEEVAFVMVARSSVFHYFSTSVSSTLYVSRDFFSSLIYYAKGSFIHYYMVHIRDSRCAKAELWRFGHTQTEFARIILSRIAVDDAMRWNILWSDKTHSPQLEEILLHIEYFKF